MSPSESEPPAPVDVARALAVIFRMIPSGSPAVAAERLTAAGRRLATDGSRDVDTPV